MKKYCTLLLGVLCAAIIAACSHNTGRTVTLQNIQTPISSHHHYSNDQIRDAIVQAGLGRKWMMNQISPGVIDAHLDNRKHSAAVRITYSASGYTINYVNSHNLMAENGQIHRNYNRWVNNLDRDIQIKLSAIAVK